jgi:hypothetical protein
MVPLSARVERYWRGESTGNGRKSTNPHPAVSSLSLSLGRCASIGEDLIHINGDRIDFTARSLLAVFRDIDVPAHKLFGAARNGYYAINVMKLGGRRTERRGGGSRRGKTCAGMRTASFSMMYCARVFLPLIDAHRASPRRTIDYARNYRTGAIKP